MLLIRVIIYVSLSGAGCQSVQTDVCASESNSSHLSAVAHPLLLDRSFAILLAMSLDC